ncbi:NifB/NifX family molybdenum-iron cluster-binding protein [Desulfosporosinus sp. Sb-LF]|uniref:NifB/NifX family molybdenum-iron cluster-binding protein n=1 Tax=Desulfosporosinus sp. Sb-LF TaxID=2560027 RepID=UPI00107F6C40|nr:NifB/NifX family molybdenum-iron cluster-binding protein [Desulfosporosinus sp. Sb-LF]TGE32100.1 diguanylate cyclase [Desulfosporosinus sp. Sb-LF]
MSKKIAIPTNGEVLDAHFGRAAGFSVFEIEGDQARFMELLSSTGLQHQHAGLANMFKSKGVEVLVCGGIGGGMINGLNAVGLEVVSGASGNVVDVANLYAQGKIVSTGSICAHDHGDGHDHGHHHH